MYRRAPRAQYGIGKDVQPQAEEEQSADGEHPKSGEHPHHRKHEQSVCDHN
jgi:hypothetical protein